jgi:MoaA/NifB/PqqE/SkfB family radical SAM enzyme
MRSSCCGVHLFNRATGLNILVDDIQVPPALWAQAPRQVSIALTSVCDLACSYCFAPKMPAWLEVERVVHWLDELDANHCLGIGFGGGEPTLHRHLPELCRYATENTVLAVSFTTHAHHLDDSLAAALAGNVHFVRVSMDGVGVTYEALRGRSFATFRKRLDTVRNLSSFGINYVVNSRTLLDLDAALALAAETGAAEFLLLPEHPVRGRGGIDDRTAQAFRQWVIRYSGPVPLTVSETDADGLPFCDPLAGETGLRAFAHIDALGTLKRSSYDSVGATIGSDGFMEALKVLEESKKEV